jgi:serpin B
MVILLPEKSMTITEFEATLDMKKLDTMMAYMKYMQATIYVPRFTMTSGFELAKTLADMGMPDAFDLWSANFSGMTGHNVLYIKEVVHKAFVDVEEQGTEAAAATGVIIESMGVILIPQVMFRADRPFLFLIRENTTGSILFVGRVVDPSK